MTNAKVAEKAAAPKIPSDAYKYEELIKELGTKSAMIRRLTSERYTRTMIASFMGIRYQHVRNVLVQDAMKAELAAK